MSVAIAARHARSAVGGAISQRPLLAGAEQRGEAARRSRSAASTASRSSRRGRPARRSRSRRSGRSPRSWTPSRNMPAHKVTPRDGCRSAYALALVCDFPIVRSRPLPATSRTQRSPSPMSTNPIGGGQIGRSVPRLEGAREGHRPRRIHASCGCPACCTARSSAARCRTAASNRSTPARRRRSAASIA